MLFSNLGETLAPGRPLQTWLLQHSMSLLSHGRHSNSWKVLTAPTTCHLASPEMENWEGVSARSKCSRPSRADHEEVPSHLPQKHWCCGLPSRSELAPALQPQPRVASYSGLTTQSCSLKPAPALQLQLRVASYSGLTTQSCSRKPGCDPAPRPS